jgi:DNA polymerase-3 subunit chi
MPLVEFHTGHAEPLAYACRLLGKAWRRRARVLVCAAPEVVAALDRELWTFDDRDFVPHGLVDALDADTLGRTPHWLAAEAALASLPAGAPATWVRLPGAGEGALPGGFERLIEVVGSAPEEASAARRRWRAYVAAGHDMKHVGPAS